MCGKTRLGCLAARIAAVLTGLGVLAVIGASAIAQSPSGIPGEPASARPLQLAQAYSGRDAVTAASRKRRPSGSAEGECPDPWSYSQGLERCICVRDGYGLIGGDCVKLADSCQQNTHWSRQEQRCVCNEGFAERGGECVSSGKEAAESNPFGGAVCIWPRVTTQAGDACRCADGYRKEGDRCLQLKSEEAVRAALESEAFEDKLLTSDVALIQQCLKEAGYLSGPVKDAMDEKAWTAFWYFKQEHPVGPTLKGVHEVKVQHVLFKLCPETSRQLPDLPAWAQPVPSRAAPAKQKPSREQAAASPSPSPDSTVSAGPPVSSGGEKRIYAKPEADCLPEDLYRLITDTYGPRASLKQCKQTCIAIPESLSRREIDELEKREGITWCRACIELESRLPLADVLRIERAADVQLCVRPPSQLPKWSYAGGSGRRAYTRVRELYRIFPPSKGHRDDIAVVIGNKTYRNDMPANENAHANAGAVYALLTEHLGYRQENVIDLRDAKLADLVSVFGSQEDHQGELWRLLQDQPRARVLIYYAGHATTDAEQKDSFLLPVDSIRYREARSAYAISLLYKNIEKLEAKSVLLLLEADFGRDLSGFVYPPNLPEMPSRSLPPEPMSGVTVIAASEKDQKTLDDPKYGIGLFTRYLIEGLAGRADLKPIGNSDNKIDAVELYAYTGHMVRLTARKSYGLLQRPVMSRSGNVLVSRVQPHLR